MVAEKICRGYREGLDGLSMKVGPGCHVGPSVVMERFCRGYHEGPSGMSAEGIVRARVWWLRKYAKGIVRAWMDYP